MAAHCQKSTCANGLRPRLVLSHKMDVVNRFSLKLSSQKTFRSTELLPKLAQKLAPPRSAVRSKPKPRLQLFCWHLSTLVTMASNRVEISTPKEVSLACKTRKLVEHYRAKINNPVTNAKLNNLLRQNEINSQGWTSTKHRVTFGFRVPQVCDQIDHRCIMNLSALDKRRPCNCQRTV